MPLDPLAKATAIAAFAPIQDPDSPSLTIDPPPISKAAPKQKSTAGGTPHPKRGQKPIPAWKTRASQPPPSNNAADAPSNANDAASNGQRVNAPPANTNINNAASSGQCANAPPAVTPITPPPNFNLMANAADRVIPPPPGLPVPPQYATRNTTTFNNLLPHQAPGTPADRWRSPAPQARREAHSRMQNPREQVQSAQRHGRYRRHRQ